MRRFISTILISATLFIGIGAIIENTWAKVKCDERALKLIRAARTAIGGEANINRVQSMTIAASATKSIEIEGTTRSGRGDLEINLQLPNMLSKMLMIKHGEGTGETQTEMEKNVEVVVIRNGEAEKIDWKSKHPEAAVGERKIIVRTDGANKGTEQKVIVTSDGEVAPGKRTMIFKSDGASPDATGKEHRVVVEKNVRVNSGESHHNELVKLTLALLASSPTGIETTFTYGGESDVDGTACDVVIAQTGAESVKLFLSKSSRLPTMISYGAPKMTPHVVKMDGAKAHATAGAKREIKVVTKNVDAEELVEYQVKFSDYRNVDGLNLPHRWSQTVEGKDDELVEVTGYAINPADIADKFAEPNQKGLNQRHVIVKKKVIKQ